MKERVLIVGSTEDDSVAGGYRRAIAEHYDVHTVDPADISPSLRQVIGFQRYVQVQSAAELACRVVAREPLALGLRRVVREAERFRPDLILVVCIAVLPPATVASLKALCKGPVIGVFPDAISNFERAYFFVADYDALFFKDHFIVERLRKKLAWTHVHYLPQACDPSLHRPVELTDTDRREFGCDLTLAGNPHTYRTAQLACLAGRDLKLWGARPPLWLHHPLFAHHQGRHVTGDLKSKTVLAAKIVINANHYAELAGANQRTYEVAATGGFQITDTPCLREVFSEDEVASFDTQRDMLEQIDHYLPRPDLRAAMSGRARIRALAEHTYAHRWAAKMAVLRHALPDGFPIDPSTLVHRAE